MCSPGSCSWCGECDQQNWEHFNWVQLANSKYMLISSFPLLPPLYPPNGKCQQQPHSCYEGWHRVTESHGKLNCRENWDLRSLVHGPPSNCWSSHVFNSQAWGWIRVSDLDTKGCLWPDSEFLSWVSFHSVLTVHNKMELKNKKKTLQFFLFLAFSSWKQGEIKHWSKIHIAK